MIYYRKTLFGSGSKLTAVHSSMTPVIYWINLFLENTNTTTQIMPMTNKISDPVLTKTMKPKSARPNAINPNLSLDITFLLYLN